MRMLLTCVSGYSHLFNMVPLALAARERGHEVAFSSAIEVTPVAEAAGFPLLPAGPGRLRMRTEIMRSFADEISDDLRDWSTGARMFGAIAPSLRWEPLCSVVEAFRPHMIVNEALELAGPLVARLYGLPHFFHSIGPYHEDSLSLVWERAAELYRQHLGTSVDWSDIIEPYLDICPDPLQTQAGRHLANRQPIRLRAYHGTLDRTPQPAPVVPQERLRVVITFGTVSNDAIQELFESAAALGSLDAEVVMTLGPRGWFDWTKAAPTRGGGAVGDPLDLGPNVRAVDFVPLDAELPSTSVLVHHGGCNTMRAAIEHGIPMLVIPHGAEQYLNARWVVDQGLGRMLMPADVTPERVVEDVLALAAEAPRARLAEARAAWYEMPAPLDVFTSMERQVEASAARTGLIRHG